MDIAALSTTLSQMKVQHEAGISVMKMAMEAGKAQVNDMMKMLEASTNIMEQSVNPHIGGNVDIRI